MHSSVVLMQLDAIDYLFIGDIASSLEGAGFRQRDSSPIERYSLDQPDNRREDYYFQKTESQDQIFHVNIGRYKETPKGQLYVMIHRISVEGHARITQSVCSKVFPVDTVVSNVLDVIKNSSIAFPLHQSM